jgi:hypothetical protein
MEEKQMNSGSFSPRNILIRFLKEATTEFDEKKENTWLELLKYAFLVIGNKRLPYGDITEEIYNLNSEKVDVINDNLTKIIESANEADLGEEVLNNFRRFEDHIHLAITQKEYIHKNIESLNSEISDAKEKVDELGANKAKIYTEFVAILGIFTAVILSAFGSFQVIGSVFDNIKEVPTGKLLVFSSLTSMGVIMLLFLLMRWINRVIHIDNETNNWGSSFKENRIFISSLIILFYILSLGFLLYATEPKETIFDILSQEKFGIGIFLFLTIASITVFCFTFRNKNKN